MIAGMRFFQHVFLPALLLSAIAGAEPPPPRLATKFGLDGSGSAASPRKSETLLQPRATHRVSVRVSDLHWAALEDDVVDVKRVIAAGADFNARETLWGGERPLHYAAVSGGSGSVRALIAAGASLEARDDAGDTALREALRPDDDNFRALKVLLAAGADPVALRPDGSTALHEAVRIEHAGGWNAVYLLRIFGADPNAADEIGARPLHYAVLRPEENFWGWTLDAASLDPHERAVDVNAKDNDGQTPLHWVVSIVDSARDHRVLRWLVNKGADVNAVDNFGSTPLDWAVYTRRDELAEVLRGYGGELRERPNPNP